MNQSIDDILTEAFNKIRDQHGVALKFVYFDLIDSSSQDRKRYDVFSIDIDAKLCDRKGFE